MSASASLHDLITAIIEDAVQDSPQSPDQVRPYTDRVLQAVAQFSGTSPAEQEDRTAGRAETTADPHDEDGNRFTPDWQAETTTTGDAVTEAARGALGVRLH